MENRFVNTFPSLLLITLAALGGWLLWRLARRLPPFGPARKGPADAAPENDPLFSLALHPGEDGKTFLYALETCRHCRAAREFMEENDLEFHILYVDHYTGKDRARLMDKVRSCNPRGSFPTFVLPGGKVVAGFREQLLREALLND
jgi:glutaredoxin-like protein NrdH